MVKDADAIASKFQTITCTEHVIEISKELQTMSKRITDKFNKTLEDVKAGAISDAAYDEFTDAQDLLGQRVDIEKIHRNCRGAIFKIP